MFIDSWGQADALSEPAHLVFGPCFVGLHERKPQVEQTRHPENGFLQLAAGLFAARSLMMSSICFKLHMSTNKSWQHDATDAAVALMLATARLRSRMPVLDFKRSTEPLVI